MAITRSPRCTLAEERRSLVEGSDYYKPTVLLGCAQTTRQVPFSNSSFSLGDAGSRLNVVHRRVKALALAFDRGQSAQQQAPVHAQARPDAVGWQAKRSKRAQKRLRKERAEDSQTSIPSSRKKTANSPPERPAGLPGAFVYGDGNARRLKRAVLQASAWHRGVHCRTKKDATFVETMEAIETATDVWDSTEAIVVLHAGLSDIQDDTSPHDSTERFKSQITSWKARAKGHFFVVYGVPEVGPKDDTMRIKCELWNQNLRQICSDIGTRVEFVSVTKALQDKTNGTSYSEHVAEQLGQRLGRRLCAFLGLRPSGNHKHRAWSVKPTTSMMTALGQAILQMANPQSRKKSKDIHVGFLNLHGARTASKWEELYQMMGEEDIEIYAVAETHLRVTEEPPVHKSWQWASLNRSGESRKGGGIGFLWKTRSAWKKLDSPCVEHMWVEGYL
ncbi:hypothetical protein HPB52_011092 [Rhipicephalus sanguineus]|uniref:Uncharacterized protein n=1 Tax=Rhipicephalus sanguineus TaxID=34632 RepID=A0A9D4T023_RHISA|nr:hypothetical protein HPB52_011092 [Rhipicephalus sanguineus]